MDMNSTMKFAMAWNQFKNNHPKFPAFLKALTNKGIKEGSVVEIIVTSFDGEKIESSIKITKSDLELFESIKNMQQR
ncbi:MAG: hypothetical protein MJ113_04130 [Lachnospiraceae bacterium]|nr:hypothetical protein [Lachnospiraceae bacterium]